jgi:hypothetical protein
LQTAFAEALAARARVLESEKQSRIDNDISMAVARQRETHTGIPETEPHFAQDPTQVRNRIINYGTSEGIKLFNATIAPLTSKYTGEMTGLHIFLKDL